jgi:hypothetical protein
MIPDDRVGFFETLWKAKAALIPPALGLLVPLLILFGPRRLQLIIEVYIAIVASVFVLTHLDFRRRARRQKGHSH